MRCPGQDWQYWQGAVTFEAPCPACGQTVEFFKDEPARRCRHCGHRLTNPRLCLDCAEWCEHAAECLGTGFQGAAAPAAEARIAVCLIQLLETELAGQPHRLARALLVFQHAKELAAAADADGRVILPAALLAELFHPGGGQREGTEQSAEQTQSVETKARQWLSRCGLDEQTSERVCRCLFSLAQNDWQSQQPHSTDMDAQRQLLADACTLADISLWRRDVPPGSTERHPPAPDPLLLSRLLTDAGRQRAQRLFNLGGRL